LAALLIVSASCTHESGQKAANEETPVADSISPEASPEITVLPYSVEYDEKTQNLNLIRSKDSPSDMDSEDIIRVINKKYPGLKLDLVARTADTISVKIDDASKLTQEMGTAGAEAYLAELTYSLPK
jgi:hypothetical protein